ncbi:MAG: SAM-dependent chlorinase/fluorinase [Chloroflexota bacterium]
MNRIITLTTDFGTRDVFVGVMKGVILSINPQAIIIDITHDIAPQNIEQGAFLFANAVKYFPAPAIHVVVVDPGVGSARRPMALQLGETMFVAPDNGVLSLAIRDWRLEIRKASPISNLQSPPRAVHLSNAKYFLPRVSATFHGRDIFAPVAAHLSLGVPLDALGEPIDDWVKLSACANAARLGEEIVGRVVHIDRFGNAITNIGEELLAGMDRARVIVRVGGRALRGIKATYASAAPGEAIALISSSWHVEIAVRDGSAAQTLGVQIGDEIVVSPE